MASQLDHVLRAMTFDGSFRVVAVEATRTAAGIVEAQKATGDEAKIFAELALAAILFRETMAPELRVQTLLHGVGGGRMAIDAHPDGSTRGLISRKSKDQSIVLGVGASLEMIRTLPNGKGFRGVVGLDEKASVSQAFMEYMQASEQIVTMIALAAVFDGPTLQRAMGYLVQLTPETRAEPLAIMTDRLPQFESIEDRCRNATQTPESIIHDLLEQIPYEITTERTVEYRCQCSAARVFASVASLPKKDIEELSEATEPLELSCDYCNQIYHMGPAELRGLLVTS